MRLGILSTLFCSLISISVFAHTRIHPTCFLEISNQAARLLGKTLDLPETPSQEWIHARAMLANQGYHVISDLQPNDSSPRLYLTVVDGFMRLHNKTATGTCMIRNFFDIYFWLDSKFYEPFDQDTITNFIRCDMGWCAQGDVESHAADACRLL